MKPTYLLIAVAVVSAMLAAAWALSRYPQPAQRQFVVTPTEDAPQFRADLEVRPPDPQVRFRAAEAPRYSSVVVSNP